MINQLKLETQLPSSVLAASELENLDQRLLSDSSGSNGDQYIEQLYASLKKVWGDNENITSKEIIEHMRNFVAADGVSPYGNIRSHTGALAQIMGILKDNGEDTSSIYGVLNQGVGFSVVSNGILDSFIFKMIERPEEVDSW